MHLGLNRSKEKGKKGRKIRNKRTEWDIFTVIGGKNIIFEKRRVGNIFVWKSYPSPQPFMMVARGYF